MNYYKQNTMNQKITYRIPGLDAIDQVAQQFLSDWAGSRIFAFEGDLGAGKTTFIKALCKHLQAIDDVSSPTFAIINVYRTQKQALIYHFDLYRLKDEEELLAIGAMEYFDSDAWCFIEWPDIAQNLLPDHAVIVKMTVADDGSRKLETQAKV